jgi:hypothetical protein
MRALLCLLLLPACGGGVLEGADAVPEHQMPSGRVVSELSPTDCVDQKGQAVARPATRIRVVMQGDGKPLLVEQRPGYDALVVHNAFSDGQYLVFQAISTPDDADPALHEYRLRWPSASGGQLADAEYFEATFYAGGSFKAVARMFALTCKLSKPGGDLDKPEPVRYEERPPGAPAPGGVGASG